MSAGQQERGGASPQGPPETSIAREGPAAEPARGTPAAGPVGGRKEVGNSATSRKHPPHVTPNAEDAELQENQPSPNDVAVRPANAQGQDKISTTEQAQPIDEGSMYDRRPEEDKDRPPSSPNVP